MSLTKHPLALGRVAGGNHLSAAQDEPEPFQFTESQLLQADAERDFNKGPKLAARGDLMALELQVQHLRSIGGL